MSLSSIVGIFDLRRIGMCDRCLRTSFVAMICAWIVVFIANQLAYPTGPIALISISLTALWLAHIVTRASRSTQPAELENNARRRALRSFGRAIVGAAGLSVAFPWQAHADSGCGGWAGNSGCLPCTRCSRQDRNCNCYSCRSCGSNCNGNC